MAGTNTYSVCMVFYVKAEDDDEALREITRTLERNISYDWAWIYTTLNKGESN
jgi:hypothetical protein